MQLDIKEIADKADMIINGYAFTKDQKLVRVLNLNCLNHSAVIYDDKIIEAMHVHASDRKLTEAGSAKFFVMSNGDTTVEKKGNLTDREIRKIRELSYPFLLKIHHDCTE